MLLAMNSNNLRVEATTQWRSSSVRRMGVSTIEELETRSLIVIPPRTALHFDHGPL
jgi:hypothetical protein